MEANPKDLLIIQPVMRSATGSPITNYYFQREELMPRLNGITKFTMSLWKEKHPIGKWMPSVLWQPPLPTKDTLLLSEVRAELPGKPIKVLQIKTSGCMI